MLLREGRRRRENSLERLVFSMTESLVRKGREMRAVVLRDIFLADPVKFSDVMLPISSRQVIRFRHKESNL